MTYLQKANDQNLPPVTAPIIGDQGYGYARNPATIDNADKLGGVAAGAYALWTGGASNMDLGSGYVYKVNGVQVLGARKTGWSVWTGTPDRTAHATYSGTASAGYVQAELQGVMDKVKQLSETLKALIDDLHSTAGHGTIGT